jgi:asparagine synthase (glutamine-hydrolysing)
MQPWRCVVDIVGFQVHAALSPAGPPARVLENGTGAILGTLFRRVAEPSSANVVSEVRLTSADTARILASDGDDLIQRYWGDYVALFLDRALRVRIIRGPASTLLCLHTQWNRVQIWFSDTESAARITGRSFTIAWMNLAHTWLGPETTVLTHLDEVTELLPGQCHDVGLDGTRRTLLLWRPLEIAQRPHCTTREQAARELKDTIQHSTQTLARSCTSVVVALSGGLDSSVTLAALSSARPRHRIVCLNQYGGDTESDERLFAQLAAEHHGCELIVAQQESAPDLRDAIHRRCSELCPGLRIRSLERVEVEIAHSVRAEAILRGDGGDEIFCRNALPLYIVDYMRTQKTVRGAWPYAMQAAMAEGVTVWSVLARVLRLAWTRSASTPNDQTTDVATDSTLLHPDVLRTLLARRDTDAPYASGSGTVLPGRAWQINLMTARRRFSGPFDQVGDAPRIAPLLSQPVMELCLTIPTWYQMSAYQDRALVREGFAGALPAAILTRRSKGGAEGLARALLRHNRHFICTMLLEGIVARSGIIDRRRLHLLLNDSPATRGLSSVALFDLLGAEIWACAWSQFTRADHQSGIGA